MGSTVLSGASVPEGGCWFRDAELGVLLAGYVHHLDENRVEVFVTVPGPLVRQTETELVLTTKMNQEGSDASSPDGYPLPPVEVKKVDDATYAVRKDGRLLTNLRFGDAIRPYFMPLSGPFGASVTREFPLKKVKGGSTDHVHHRSLWTGWGDVNGADNWSEGITGVPQRVEEVTVARGCHALGHLQFRATWMDRDGEDPVLEEVRDAFFYNLWGPETLADVRVRFTATHGDVRFGDTKEGGFVAVRVADPLRGSHGGRIENAHGMLGEVECWGKRAGWCDYSGMLDGSVVGVALMDHPSNAGYPTRWHVRDYGLMAANPFGLSHFEPGSGADGSRVLPAGDTLEFRYRVYVHAGTAREANVAERYLDFVNPPELKHLSF